MQVGPYLIKFAETSDELDQVHRLNFATFVREIPQHADPGTGETLVDKFHAKNTYLIAVRDGRVVGMLSAHDHPPFSVADRLPDPAVLSAPGVKPVEIRLLAVEPAERNSPVTIGLVWRLFHYAKDEGFTHFIISAVVEQREMYEHLGFETLGPPVGKGRASFLPMWATLEQVHESMGRTMRLLEKRFRWKTATNSVASEAAPQAPPLVCLLPGPVAIAERVHAAFREPLVYHRADEFTPLFEHTRVRLSNMVGGKPVALFVGSGTLANDAVAATLAADPMRDVGLNLVNGEFGSRLLKQATRWGLTPRVMEWDWGKPWDLAAVEAAFQDMPTGGWVWGVHHETSTGVLNDLAGLIKLAKKYGHRVCADCVSSIGTVEVDLREVYLGSAASGKAIGSYAGIAMVFANPADLAHLEPDTVPTYLDVAATIHTVGSRFTVPSPLIKALDSALETFSTKERREARFAQIAELGMHLRKRLQAAGLAPLSPEAIASPAIVTFAPPISMSAADFVATCKDWGYQVAGQSGYLADRRLVQIAVMGTVTKDQLDALLDKLAG